MDSIQVWPPSGASLLFSSSLVYTSCSRKHSLSSSVPNYLLFQYPEINKTCTHQLASPTVIHSARRCRMPTARVSRVSPAQSHWVLLRNSITSDNACLPARAAEHAPRPTLSITQRCCRCGCICLIQSPNCLPRNEAAAAGLAFAVSSVAYGFNSLLFLLIVRE